ncbi:MAG TPA: glycoside hydrolase family 2 TIM barrel-domain containing protein [Candidatus Limnocylindria bacterium]|nr:glycoside hydrolase family 2 TIM barrel-domain containing protein [Candidatus Limnocylindria bacterium]
MGLAFGGRQTIPLDGRWQLIPDSEGRLQEDRLPDGVAIDVPGCWEAQVGRGLIIAWYRRYFGVPADWEGSRIVLVFGAVMYHAKVFLNGRSLGEHEGGYTPFELDAGEAVRWGASNEIVVRVVNPLDALEEYPATPADIAAADARVPEFPISEIPHGKQTWYSSQSGIWQSVRAERRSRPSLGPLRVRVDLAESAVCVAWRLEPDGGPMQARATSPESLSVELTITGPSGEIAGRAMARPDAKGVGEVRFTIADPRLWDIGRPNLYDADARLVSDGVVLDAKKARFGMREIATRDGRILLNGRPIYLIGALDQDLYPESISTPPSRAMLDEQLARARELGLNLLRCHIKVPDPAYFDAADEAGMLLWCELPNWRTFTPAAARRGRETLQAMVEAHGNHPSIVIWTIVNEDWGTRVREEARDRAWLADTFDWLKALDPGRLVVDNSACDTASTPNFHVRTDLADFHIYHGAPDNAEPWRNRIDDFARRPAWLWSPHGDATSRGDEPLVLSEFGSWGLPRIDGLGAGDGESPWWFETGRGHLRPAGIRQRFSSFGLDRIWPTLDDLAEATQWHQFETLQYEVGQLRRHDSIQGYVITELSDAYWEANGLLDVARGRKAFHERSASINAQDVVVVDLERRDACPGDTLAATVYVASYRGPSTGGEIGWELQQGDATLVSGRMPLSDWPNRGARTVGCLEIPVPAGARPGDAQLVVRAFDATGTERAGDSIRLAVLTSGVRQTASPLAIAVDEPLGLWDLEGRIAPLGHRLTAQADADLVVSSEVGDDLLRRVEAGGRALVLVRARSSIPADHRLSRPVSSRARGLPDPAAPDQRSPWDGDWVTSWSWILPGVLPNLPVRNPLDFAYAEVIPDHVLVGYDPERHRDEVIAGMFSGWVHAPAALIWRFRQGAGAITLTTFRVAPGRGPLSSALLEGLIQYARDQDPDGGG